MEYSLQRFVPQFYLRRFLGKSKKIWVYDKETDRIFATSPRNLAAEHGLYTLQNFVDDPLYLEKSFSGLEEEASTITDSWIRQLATDDKVMIGSDDREAMSLYLALQLLRTTEARTLMLQGLFDSSEVHPTADELQMLHLRLLWNDGLVEETKKTLSNFLWMFAKSISNKPFWTSDDPVRVRSLTEKNCLTWAQINQESAYLAWPITPKWILFCYDRSCFRNLDRIERFENHVSPVPMTAALIDAENIPQVGHAHRFVFSDSPDFFRAKEFCDLHPILRNPDRGRFENPSRTSGVG